MPLKKGSSNKTISGNVGELMHTYKTKGKIGTSSPANKKKAQKQAVAIALNTAGKSKINDCFSRFNTHFLTILKEATKKDYDGDGKVESPEKEYKGVRDKAIKKAKVKSEDNEGKKKGSNGKACWKGYRYAGTKNGKDRCVKVRRKK